MIINQVTKCINHRLIPKVCLNNTIKWIRVFWSVSFLTSTKIQIVQFAPNERWRGFNANFYQSWSIIKKFVFTMTVHFYKHYLQLLFRKQYHITVKTLYFLKIKIWYLVCSMLIPHYCDSTNRNFLLRNTN
jgi:hypothetical protein